jgi:hypothetical protein
MRLGAHALVLLLLVAAPAAAASSIAGLAAKMADQIAAVTGGRAVELVVPEDRTGRGAQIALDLGALISARLLGRVTLRDSGERLRVVSVLSDAGGRLVLSARVTAEPEGRLVDLLSASVENDGRLAALTAERPPRATVIEIVSTTRTPTLDDRVLDLAFVADDEIAVLSNAWVDLYRIDSSQIERRSRLALPNPTLTVRAPAGMLLPTAESSLWSMTNRSPKALLLGIDNGRLRPRGEAGALPWRGSAEGVRYRAGTNLLDGPPERLGPGPLLCARSGRPETAVSADGELRIASDAGPRSGPRVGSCVSPLWGGLLVASSDAPPGAPDALLVLKDDPNGTQLLDRIPVEGTLRGIAARARPGGARLVAAVEDASSASLLVMDLRSREP